MKKIKMTLVLFTGLMLPFISIAQDVKSETSIDFEIRNLGINVDGNFTDASIKTNFTNDDVSQWRLSATVNVNSINTDNNKRDEHLLKADYFDANTYSKITLDTTNFKKISKNKYDVTVNLTIKNTTKTITIPMQIIKEDEGLNLKMAFELNRRDYGVGGRSFILSNTVKIVVNYTFKKD